MNAAKDSHSVCHPKQFTGNGVFDNGMFAPRLEIRYLDKSDGAGAWGAG